MTADITINILKEAILLEKRGQAFYRQIAGQSRHPEVKNFFGTMADEEARHVQILENQFAAYARDQQFLPLSSQDTESLSTAQMILTDNVKQQLASADFEAAAISAAMLMEERAVKLYSERAQSARNPTEKALYQWLSNWEQGHLSYLAQLDRELKEAIWNDQQFWPF